jgi:hypothetical protein
VLVGLLDHPSSTSILFLGYCYKGVIIRFGFQKSCQLLCTLIEEKSYISGKGYLYKSLLITSYPISKISIEFCKEILWQISTLIKKIQHHLFSPLVNILSKYVVKFNKIELIIALNFQIKIFLSILFIKFSEEDSINFNYFAIF